MAPPVPGVQKPPCWVGKQFRDHLEAAPKSKVKILAGLKTRPAWLQQDRLGVNLAVCRGKAEKAVKALRRLTAMTSSRDPTQMVKERGLQHRMA
jgi:hypothetical protein